MKVRANCGSHHQFFLHPLALFSLLVLGVLLSGITFQTMAGSYEVTGRIEAPPLASGATITSPVPNQVFTSKPIRVTGACPDESYVKLFRNGLFSGVSVCSSNSYSIETDLFEGANTLKVQAYNRTDIAGPDTPEITVTFTMPGKIGPAETPAATYIPPTTYTGGQTSVTTAPLIIWSDYKFHVIPTGDEFRWTIRFQFGKAPYRTAVLWGDSSRTDLTIANTEPFEITHKYDSPGYYPVTVEVTDSTARSTRLQLLALVKEPGTPGTISNILKDASIQGGAAAPSRAEWLWFAWPTYLVLTLMVASFWLGERREYLQLLKASPRLKHSHR